MEAITFRKTYRCLYDERLGEGGFGEVFMARRRQDGEAFVVKTFKKERPRNFDYGEDGGRKVPKEFEMLIRCQGIPNVIQIGRAHV